MTEQERLAARLAEATNPNRPRLVRELAGAGRLRQQMLRDFGECELVDRIRDDEERLRERLIALPAEPTSPAPHGVQ